jgi:heavy metal sensor kinase
MREVALVNPRGMRMVVGRSITTDLADLRRLAWWLALAGVGVLLLGMGGGWWIATRAIGPIADISFTAQKIAAGRLSQRIESKDTDSELGQLAQVLNATFDRLQAALDRQTQFTADASHELRTPVAVLLSQTQTALSRVRSEPDYREALEVCQRTAQRMRRVIESLLTLARLDSGEAAVTRESCALDRITRQALRLLEPLATEQGVAIRIEADPVHCFGDGHLLEQLVTNLVGNALVYNQRDGEVRVALKSLGQDLELQVSNTGPGIAPEHLEHVFDRFFRADKARARSEGHTGLGLAITKSIVEAHGGTIQVASEPGARTTFTVRLPQSEALSPNLAHDRSTPG